MFNKLAEALMQFCSCALLSEYYIAIVRYYIACWLIEIQRSWSSKEVKLSTYLLREGYYAVFYFDFEYHYYFKTTFKYETALNNYFRFDGMIWKLHGITEFLHGRLSYLVLFQEPAVWFHLVWKGAGLVLQHNQISLSLEVY